MPEPKQDLPKKDVPQKKPAPQGQNKKNTNPAQKPPAQEKDDAFKYEMQYANGGFNNGVEIKPDREGKAQLKVSIYGGGEQKVMKISPLPASITKLTKAYELSADKADDSSPEITEELQKYFDEVRSVLSAKIIQIVTQMDEQIKTAITQTFKEVNKGY